MILFACSSSIKGKRGTYRGDGFEIDRENVKNLLQISDVRDLQVCSRCVVLLVSSS